MCYLLPKTLLHFKYVRYLCGICFLKIKKLSPKHLEVTLIFEQVPYFGDIRTDIRYKVLIAFIR